jgi:hypothetical protein
VTEPWAPATRKTTSAESVVPRIAGWVIGLLLGGLFGALGTIVSQSTIALGSLTIPIGLIVALPAVALLLIGLRLVLRTRTAALLAGLGLAGTVLLLSQMSAGGSVLVPNNALGYVWTLAPTFIALVVLAWPRLTRRA